MTEWKPIETAPKDRSVLAWAPGWESEQRIWWDNNEAAPSGYWQYAESALAELEPEAHPTLWLDIPFPPKHPSDL